MKLLPRKYFIITKYELIIDRDALETQSRLIGIVVILPPIQLEKQVSYQLISDTLLSIFKV